MAGLIELSYEKAAVNAPLLHEELRAALGSGFVGISLSGGGRVRVHVLDTLPSAERERIAGLVAAHDASQRTAAQQAEAAREAALSALRKPWAAWSGADKDALLRLLAQDLGIGGL